IGVGLLTATVFETTDVRPVLPLTNRMTANVPADRNTCVVIPLLMSHVFDLAVHDRRRVARVPVERRDPLSRRHRRGAPIEHHWTADHQRARLDRAVAVGVGALPPTATVVPTDVDDCPASSVIVNWTM